MDNQRDRESLGRHDHRRFPDRTFDEHGDADWLVERIWKQEFGVLDFGYAPQKLSAPKPFDD
jgi:hypothetical protein